MEIRRADRYEISIFFLRHVTTEMIHASAFLVSPAGAISRTNGRKLMSPSRSLARSGSVDSQDRLAFMVVFAAQNDHNYILTEKTSRPIMRRKYQNRHRYLFLQVMSVHHCYSQLYRPFCFPSRQSKLRKNSGRIVQAI